jgi:hypothetical protein
MKTLKLLASIFGLAGLIMLAIGIWLLQNTISFKARALHAQGRVVELRREEWSSNSHGHQRSSYHPVVEFEVNQTRITFVSNSGTNPPAYSVNERVDVLYDPSDPNRAKLNGFFSLWGAAAICLLIGGVFSSVGLGRLIAPKFGERKIAWLRQNGERIQAELAGVKLNTSLHVNGRHPWRITARWRDPYSGKMHLFLSQNIWFNPERYLNGRQIEVLIAPGNPKKYWVNTSFLPELEE